MEIEYKGERIVQVAGNYPCEPFTMQHVFKVIDEFDTDALPLVQTLFWSPNDAKAAVDLCKGLKLPPKWATTLQHEYNQMLLYRQHFGRVFCALKDIRHAVRESQDFDENPGPEILRILDRLHQGMYE